METSGRAYGAGKVGESFSLMEFVRRPRTIMRTLSWIFAIIVFGCIVSEGYLNDKCIFNNNDDACHYGVAIGIIAFMAAIALFISDLVFPSITSAKKRKKIVMADIAFCGLWTFMYFVGFCLLTNMWSKTTDKTFGKGNAEAAIAFTFFSTLSWGSLTYLGIQDYREGTLSAFAPTYTDPSLDQSSSPYSSFPGGESTLEPSYQAPPFTLAESSTTEYQPPTY